METETIYRELEAMQTAISELGKQVEAIKLKLNKVETPIKILIGTPICTEKLYCWPEFVAAIKKLKMPYKGATANVLICDTSDSCDIKELVLKENFIYEAAPAEKPMDRVVGARNRIFEYAGWQGYDYVLFIDSDVIAPPETVSRLISHRVDFVTGFYPIPNFYGMPVPCAKYLNEDLYVDFPAEKIDGLLHTVDLTGLGLTLISRNHFLRMFRCERDEHGGVKKSEDICYCQDMLKDGQKVYFDTGLIAKHKTSGNHWDEA